MIGRDNEQEDTWSNKMLDGMVIDGEMDDVDLPSNGRSLGSTVRGAGLLLI